MMQGHNDAGGATMQGHNDAGTMEVQWRHNDAGAQ